MAGENFDFEKNGRAAIISEDYLLLAPEKIAALLLSKLNLNTKLFARNCVVKKIPKESAEAFLTAWHLMGPTQSGSNRGLYHKDELLAVASFSKGRKMNRLPGHKRSFELIRFCCKPGITITGGLSKLVKNFYTEKEAGDIMTYVDLQMADGSSFSRAGFKKHSDISANYLLVNKKSWQRHLLKDPSAPYDKELYYRTRNSGSIKMIFQPDESLYCIAVLGTTASGKTRLACQLAHQLNGAVISADSRQVYKHLDIGSGKDLSEYIIKGQNIEHYLIDVIEPAEQYYLHDFIAGLRQSFNSIVLKQQLPIICGGTGLYLDALRKDFSLTMIKENPVLRETLEALSQEDLLKKLQSYAAANTQHVDLNSRKRLIRGIEVAEFIKNNGGTPPNTELPYRPFYIGLKTELETRRRNISFRLKQRLDHGLIEEVKGLLKRGISEERLAFFGLEYKFVLFYLQGKISKEALFTQLETAIFQFAKRQMTWFRKMEKEGVQIHWVEKDAPLEPLLRQAGFVK